MEPQDDPEARIRDLERPLADTAQASELGGAPSGGYAYPPPPPPGAVPPPPPGPPQAPYGYGYGGPFPGPAPRPPSGNRLWWILGALFVVGVLALVGGIAAFAAHRFNGGNLVVPSATPSTSQVRTIPRSPGPSTKTRTPSAGPSTSPLPPQGAELTIAGINENQTVACNDNVVGVSGVSNKVVITGHCLSLTVSGLNNSITVDAVDTIDASGLNNRVTYHSGSPKITKSGDGNVVQQG
jgi:Protein of unknown function (DUF3060)